MACVTSVRYSIKFNGAISDSFAPSCGLRQGDPLSPYLFLLVADGLSIQFDNGINSAELSLLKITRKAPGISHLLFADDNLLPFKPSHDGEVEVSSLLENYWLASRRRINHDKSFIFCNREDAHRLSRKMSRIL